MKAVFLCAGNGRRMLSPAKGIPKPMEIIGYDTKRPILEYIIDNCKDVKGIDEFLLVVRNDDKMIQDYFGDGSRFGINTRYVFQDEPQGTAHAIRCAEKYIDGSFLVVYGDNLFAKGLIDQAKTIHEHKEPLADATYVIYRLEDTTRLAEYGTVEINREYHIVKISEKNPKATSPYIATGIMFFNPSIFDAMKHNWHKSERGEYEIHDYTNVLIEQGKIVNAFPSPLPWIDITTPKDIDRANEVVRAIPI